METRFTQELQMKRKTCGICGDTIFEFGEFALEEVYICADCQKI